VPEDSNSQTSHNEAPKQNLAEIPLFQKIREHKTKLEEIRKILKPGNLRNVLNTTVEVYLTDISEIFDYLEVIKGTKESFKYIKSVTDLMDKLDEIMLELQDALDAWDMSNEADTPHPQRLDAKSDYRKHLNKCYGLLEDSLGFFKPVKQPQQGTTTEENTKPMRKSS
jgi:hypothetical protein